MPAEWEPHRATWLAWPENPDDWGDCREAVEVEFAALVAELLSCEPTHVLTRDPERARARLRELAPGTDPEIHELETVEAFLRDTGPTFVQGTEGLVAIDWSFDGWGGRHPSAMRDDGVASRVAALCDIPVRKSALHAEGGAFEVDGEGTGLATRSTLLAHNPQLSRGQVEAELRACLGVRRVLWLEGQLAGDDTGGHVDTLARFVGPGRVVRTRGGPQDDLTDLEETLRAAPDARGRTLEICELPAPTMIRHRGQPLPASYSNFYLANGAVLVPQFGVPEDSLALKCLSSLWPSRRVIGVSSRVLLRGLGSIHCLTQQQPVPASETPDQPEMEATTTVSPET